MNAKNKKSDDFSKVRNTLFTCLREGGKIMKKGFGGKISIHKKGAVNIVTQIDLAIEKKLIQIIRANFPDHQLLTEESDPRFSSSPYRWIIDPLDGTTNFAHGLAIFCISIGVEYKGKMVLGAIYNPIGNELFFAEAGKGAYLNGKRIRVSKTPKLIDSLLVTGFPYDRIERADYYLTFFKSMMKRTQGLRRLGAAAMDLAYVACGRFEAFWELNLKPWDIAAGVLIVQEAGGKVSDFSAQSIKVDEPRQLLASNGKVHNSILSVFRKIV